MAAGLPIPQIWASLVTLTALEIVLGIDNLVFIAILVGRLPEERRDLARKLGLAVAVITRLALLASIAWIIGLTKPVFELFGHALSLARHHPDRRRAVPALQGHARDP